MQDEAICIAAVAWCRAAQLGAQARKRRQNDTHASLSLCVVAAGSPAKRLLRGSDCGCACVDSIFVLECVKGVRLPVRVHLQYACACAQCVFPLWMRAVRSPQHIALMRARVRALMASGAIGPAPHYAHHNRPAQRTVGSKLRLWKMAAVGGWWLGLRLAEAQAFGGMIAPLSAAAGFSLGCRVFLRGVWFCLSAE